MVSRATKPLNFQMRCGLPQHFLSGTSVKKEPKNKERTKRKENNNVSSYCCDAHTSEGEGTI